MFLLNLDNQSIWNQRNKYNHEIYRYVIDQRNGIKEKLKWTRKSSLYTKSEKQMKTIKKR